MYDKAQSGKILSLDEKLMFHVIIIHQIEGGGLKRLGNFLLKKQSVVRIKKNSYDNLCGLRAVIVGMSIADKSDNYNTIRDSRNSLQDDLAFELANKLGFDIRKPLTIEDLIRVEKYLKNYQLIIINGDLMSDIFMRVSLSLKKLFYSIMTTIMILLKVCLLFFQIVIFVTPVLNLIDILNFIHVIL